MTIEATQDEKNEIELIELRYAHKEMCKEKEYWENKYRSCCEALNLYVAAGFGNSTDFAKQGDAHAAAVKVLKTPNYNSAT